MEILSVRRMDEVLAIALEDPHAAQARSIAEVPVAKLTEIANLVRKL